MPTRSARTAACGRATTGWRTSPGGYIYPGTAQSATSAAGTTSTVRRSSACWRTNLDMLAVAVVSRSDDAVGEMGEVEVMP
jgi:hypothetical protein